MSGSCQTERPLADALPDLLREKGLTLRRLARAAQVNHGHLSRVVRRQEGKTAGPDLARRVAEALDLPGDYFPEFREGTVVDRVRSDAALRDKLYRDLTEE